MIFYKNILNEYNFFKRIYRSQSYTLQTGRSTANLVNDQRYIFIYVYQNQHYSIEGKHI